MVAVPAFGVGDPAPGGRSWTKTPRSISVLLRRKAAEGITGAVTRLGPTGCVQATRWPGGRWPLSWSVSQPQLAPVPPSMTWWATPSRETSPGWPLLVSLGLQSAANTRFCPDEPVTRGQMAAFIVRAFEYTYDGEGDLFDDDDESVF